MSDDSEKITIKCPLCSVEHEYRLSVKRSHVLYHMLSAPSSEEKRFKSFKRTFLCPSKEKPFQAVLRFEETFGTIIDRVDVLAKDQA